MATRASNFRLPPELLDRVDLVAGHRGRTKFLISAVERELDRLGREPGPVVRHEAPPVQAVRSQVEDQVRRPRSQAEVAMARRLATLK